MKTIHEAVQAFLTGVAPIAAKHPDITDTEVRAQIEPYLVARVVWGEPDADAPALVPASYAKLVKRFARDAADALAEVAPGEARHHALWDGSADADALAYYLGAWDFAPRDSDEAPEGTLAEKFAWLLGPVVRTVLDGDFPAAVKSAVMRDVARAILTPHGMTFNPADVDLGGADLSPAAVEAIVDAVSVTLGRSPFFEGEDGLPEERPDVMHAAIAEALGPHKRLLPRLSALR